MKIANPEMSSMWDCTEMENPKTKKTVIPYSLQVRDFTEMRNPENVKTADTAFSEV